MIAIILLFLLFFFCDYLYQIKTADLLTNWKTSGSVITSGTSNYKLINSSNGKLTSIPKSLLWLVDYDTKPTYEEMNALRSRIIDHYPEFSSNAVMCGMLNDSVVVLTSHFENEYRDIVLYDISNDTYKVAFEIDGLLSVVAGHGKIFAITLPTNDSDIMYVDEYYKPIYICYPNTGEVVKIGEYNSIKESKNLVLEMVTQ